MVVLRAGYEAVNNDLKQYTLEAKISELTKPDKTRRNEKQMRALRETILEEYSVLVSTCVGAGESSLILLFVNHDSLGDGTLAELEFSHVLVDEAAQAKGSFCLIELSHFPRCRVICSHSAE